MSTTLPIACYPVSTSEASGFCTFASAVTNTSSIFSCFRSPVQTEVSKQTENKAFLKSSNSLSQKLPLPPPTYIQFLSFTTLVAFSTHGFCFEMTLSVELVMTFYEPKAFQVRASQLVEQGDSLVKAMSSKSLDSSLCSPWPPTPGLLPPFHASSQAEVLARLHASPLASKKEFPHMKMKAP